LDRSLHARGQSRRFGAADKLIGKNAQVLRDVT
jgi:hypothetical protein